MLLSLKIKDHSLKDSYIISVLSVISVLDTKHIYASTDAQVRAHARTHRHTHTHKHQYTHTVRERKKERERE